MQRQLIEVIDSLTFNSAELPALKALVSFVIDYSEQSIVTLPYSTDALTLAKEIKRLIGNYSRSVIGVTDESNG